MRCQACDYELWHCTGRVCPECGDAFSLKDFEFEVDTVLFHCPQCNDGIEGQGSNGWPNLNIERCECCGFATGLDDYIVRPTRDAESNSALLPINTMEGNWFNRYFQTVWLVMTKPNKTMVRIPLHESLGKAWGFLLTTMVLTLAISMIPSLILFAIPLMTYGNSQNSPFGSSFGIMTLISIQVLFVFVLMQFYVVAWAGITHLLLLMTGGCSFTFKRTFQAILYSGGASIVSIVPCIGGIAGMLWWNVSAVNMISKGQRVSGGRASFVVLFAPIVLTLCICGGYVFLILGSL